MAASTKWNIFKLTLSLTYSQALSAFFHDQRVFTSAFSHTTTSKIMVNLALNLRKPYAIATTEKC